MFYNIKTEGVRANRRGRGRVGTPYYIIRARMRMGRMGLMGLMGGIDGKGNPRWKSRGAGILPDGEFYRTGETRLQGRGKGRKGGKERKGKKFFPTGRKDISELQNRREEDRWWDSPVFQIRICRLRRGVFREGCYLRLFPIWFC